MVEATSGTQMLTQPLSMGMSMAMPPPKPQHTQAELDQTEEKLAGLKISEASNTNGVSQDAPTVLLVMGMAGSGKTTFVHVSTESL